MKNKLTFSLLLLAFALIANNSNAQFSDGTDLSLFLSDSLPIKDMSGNLIADPYSGGIESPRFFSMELNGDLKQDLVIFDRKNNKVSTYINNGSFGDARYRHSPEFEHLFPKGRYNFFLVDVDRDGHLDVLCGDPILNTFNFYKNDGLAAPNLHFTFKSILKYTHYQPIAPGIKNTIGNPIQHIQGIQDIDNDGDIDLITLGPFGGNLELYLNNQVDSNLSKDSLDFYLVDLCFGHFNEGLDNSVTLGTCESTKYYTRRHTGGTSVLMLDLNKDGDKDLLMGNNFFDNLLMLENGYEDYHAKYDSMIAWDSIFPRNTLQAKTTTFPSASYTDINGDGVSDLVVCPTWSTGYDIQGMNQTMLYTNSGQTDSPIFNYAGNNFLMNKSIDLGEKVSPVFFDYDADGDNDLFVCYSGNFKTNLLLKDQVALYKNIGTAQQPELQLVDMNYGDFDQYNLSASRMSIYDFDEDGKYEFFFGQLDGTVKRFKNNGTGVSPSFTLENAHFVGANAQFGYAAPAFWDVDNDGNTDVLLGSYSGNIGYFRNKGTNSAPDFERISDALGKMFTNEFTYRTNPPGFEGLGASTPLVTDLNGDGKVEIISGSIQGELFVWKPTNNPSDSFERYKDFVKYLDVAGDTINNYFFGKNTTVAAADMDGDSIQDLIVGNDAGGFFYLSGKARVFSVGIPVLKALNLTIYPNPTKNKITLTGLPTNLEKSVRLINIEGRLIQKKITKEATLELELANMPSGIYIVSVKAKGYQDFVYRVNKL